VRKLRLKIRAKFVLVVLPLIVSSLAFTGLMSSQAAQYGITGIATRFLYFKGEELRKYAETQWTLLVENNLLTNQEYLEVSKLAVESFARSLIRAETELILALDDSGNVAMNTGGIELLEEELEKLRMLISNNEGGWQEVRLAGVDRVAQTFYFQPFGWYFLVTERRNAFYQAVTEIFRRSGLVLVLTLSGTILLLMILTQVITKPLHTVVAEMRKIVSDGDLSSKVEILYPDEIGELGHTFNLMTTELQRAYNQIKSYAFQAVVAQKKEQKIRNVFQKYVPKEVIDQFFENPGSMLRGDTRLLAVLFTDIRGFTSLSENMRPDEIVESLNHYFSMMVEIIMNRNGIVDKFMGDAIMAFYGAPVGHPDDALRAVLSGFEMLEILEDFNRGQIQQGRSQFRIGIGINYGAVTVGNIGSERKMEYTVIGDMVNLASRLEGLTKIYHEPMIISESVYRGVAKTLPCRQLDIVAVKGRTRGVKIFAPRRSLDNAEAQAWNLHREGLQHYYARDFALAIRCFSELAAMHPDDRTSSIFLERSRGYLKSPPSTDWNGVAQILEK
jgi:class 3 adenylate cyclase/HAMP domain-containing protein